MKWNEVKLAQSCLTLCDPMDCSLPCSSIRGILQAKILEWVAISFSRRSSQPRDQTRVSRIAGRRFTIWATGEAHWARWGRCQLPRLDLYPRRNCNIIWMKWFVCVCVCVCVCTHTAIQENCEVPSGIPNLIGPQMEFYILYPKLTSSLLFLNLFNRLTIS